jgi:hypothetical protein
MAWGGRRRVGRGIQLKQGQMNRLEAKYAGYLEGLKRGGVILDYWFDAIRLRLAEKTFYSPDFLVLASDMTFEVHEVKGGIWEDDARVKIKVAAAKYPMRFKAVRWVKGAWEAEEFSKEGDPPAPVEQGRWEVIERE